MRWKKHSPEEIVAKLSSIREAVEAETPLSEAIRAVGVSEATYFRWRAQYGALNLDQLRRIKKLELENARLRRALADMEYVVSA